MVKTGRCPITPSFNNHSYWQKAAMIISFFMVLLATFFIISLSRSVDKELSLYARRSLLQEETKIILTNLIELEYAAQRFEHQKATILREHFDKIQKQIFSTIASLQSNSANFPIVARWIEPLKIYIKARTNLLDRQILSSQAIIKNEALVHSNLVSILRLISLCIQKENHILNHSRYELDLLRAGLSFSAIIACISIFLFAYTVYDRFQRDMYLMKRYQLELQKDNLFLEDHIKLRTVELNNARARAEKERERVEILLQDASHRIGNSLATVSSLLRMQARTASSKEVQSALLTARDHIQNISAAHRRLRLGKDGDTAAVDELLGMIIQDIKSDLPKNLAQRIKIESYIEPWQITARDATTLGIIMGELLTNAIKHAFLPEQEGKIFVAFAQREDGNFNLMVEDNGQGMADDMVYPDHKNTDQSQKDKGLGHLVVKQLCLQFGAQLYQERPPGGGTRFIIPLPSIAEQATLKTISTDKKATAEKTQKISTDFQGPRETPDLSH